MVPGLAHHPRRLPRGLGARHRHRLARPAAPARARARRPPARAREAVADHHARLLSLLPRGVPDGLARFVSPARKPQIMHVPERAPETVPDLLAGLLARGHRVLVATSGPTASANLRAALPPGLAALTATDPAMAARTAEAIRGRGASPDLALAAGREEAAARRVAEITERLRGGESDEPAPDPGDGDPELSWMPVRPDLPAAPPVSRSEAADLVVLLAEETAARKARTTQRDVDPGALPSAAYVQTLVDAEVAAVERAERSKTDLSQRLRDSDRTFLARLDGDASVVAAAFRDLGLEGHPGGWNSADLAARAFGDALGDRRPLIWARVSEMTSRAQWAERALAELGGHTVELPEDADLRGLAASAQDLRTHLAAAAPSSAGRSARPSSARRNRSSPRSRWTASRRPPPNSWTSSTPTSWCGSPAGSCSTCGRPPASPSRPTSRPPNASPASSAPTPASPASATRCRPSTPPGASSNAPASASGSRIRSSGTSTPPPSATPSKASASAAPPPTWRRCATRSAPSTTTIPRAARRPRRHRRPRRRRLRPRPRRPRRGPPRTLPPDPLRRADRPRPLRPPRPRQPHDRHRRGRGLARPHPPLGRRLGLGPPPRRARRPRHGPPPRGAGLRRGGAPHRPRRPHGRPRLGGRRRPRPVAPRRRPGLDPPLWRIPDVLPPAPDAFDVVIVDGEHEAGAEALHVLWHAPGPSSSAHPAPTCHPRRARRPPPASPATSTPR
ncbi:hypothetical protein [Actinomadura madurae]|uniref:hypothetical protein n=1 Tax=Actinomadura madurae TaxID=1993 RepID=UPI0020D20B47|nr:hypothetical protein [Actinomadura madurae]MCP9979657.1 hypothetical protein [Actinomadura madurae]